MSEVAERTSVIVPALNERQQGSSKIHLARDGVRCFLILLKGVTIFSPLQFLVPISAAAFLLDALVSEQSAPLGVESRRP